MSNTVHGENPYRWMILAIMSFLFFMINFAEFQLAGVAGRLFPLLHLTPVEFGMCLFAPFLLNFVLGIPTGMMTDRFGTRGVGSVFLLISCIGIIGRAYASTSFVSLFVWMLVFSFSMVFTNAIGPKILGTWFKHEHMPLAMGVFIGCAGFGIGIGEGTASLFPNLTQTFTCGWILFVVAVMWFLFGFRSKPEGEPAAPPQPVLAYLGVAAQNKWVWLSGIAVFFFFAAWVGTAGNLPHALAHTQKISPVAAGLLGIPLGFGGALGGFFMPTILNKLGSVKGWLALFVVVGGAMIFASLVVPFGPLTWVFVTAGAFIANGMLPLCIPFPIMLPEIGTTYAGSAGGIISLLQTAAGFFIPSFVIAMIAGEDPIKTFTVLFVLFVFSALFILILPERGFHHEGHKQKVLDSSAA
ncbi:MAG: MFS transporter [Syntrophobacteraceae bacterium]